MNILMVSLGSSGDVHPIVGLGLALKNRGHRVTVVTSGYFKELIADIGLRYTELGNLEDYQGIIKNPGVWNPRKGLGILLKDGFLPAVRQTYEIIERNNSADTVVVSSVLMYGARIAHDKLSVPLITIQLQPAGFWSIDEPPVIPLFSLPNRLPHVVKRFLFNTVDKLLDRMAGPEINSFRRELGLPAVRHLFSKWAHSPEKVIALFPKWFGSPPPDWPSQTELTGFISFDRSEQDPVPEGVMDFLDAGDLPIVFTPGTAMLHGQRFFKASLEACQLLKRRGLLLTIHREHLPTHLPDGIAHFEYVPFSAVLPRAAALVHHGGIGTVAQALAAGIPQLIMPMNFDQPDNAARLERLRVGSSLRPKKFTGENVAGKLDSLLTSQEVKRNCKNFSEKIDFAQALHDTCDAIERVCKRIRH